MRRTLYGHASLRASGVELALVLLALATACGSSDGPPGNGTPGGGSSGAAASGGTAGSGAAQVGGNGGSTGGAVPNGGSAGSFGGQAGAGDSGGKAGSSTGGAAADGGDGSGAAGVPGGSAGSAGASGGSAGATAGQGGASPGTGGDGGRGGMAPLEFRACVYVGALDRITIERIDLAAMTCTRILLQQPAGDCSLGLVSGSWCLARAIAMANTDCQGTESVAATGMSGTFAVTSDAGLLVDLDIILEFPDQAPVPEELRVEVASCDADCSGNECRP